VVQPDRCASAFKRQMGNDWTIDLAGHVFTPEKLSSLVLRALKEDAEALLGQSVEDAVITVPAYFNEHQRKATLQAGRIAGLKVLRILNEPTAAAIAYGFHESKEEKSIVVLDLGGGTFDVSVVEMFEGMVEVRSSSGDSFLGGEDFTSALAVKILEGQGHLFERVEMESPLLVARLKHLCEQAKRKLSRQDATTVRMPGKKGELPENGPEIAVTREQFQAWTEHILRRIELPIRRAVSDGGLTNSRIDEVILVGGATRMPAVVERIKTILEKQPQLRLDPDLVVAMGAAVQAGLIGKDEALNDLVVTDVAPFTLGIETSKQFGTEHRTGYMMPIIHRNTTIPISRVRRVQTVGPNQTNIVVKVFQGENRLTKNNIPLGEFNVDRIPKGPPGQEVDIRFTYDLNGVLEVEATVVETQRKVTHLIARHARGMSQTQIARALEEMQALKSTPREEAVYRTLLNRAGRVYEELPIAAQQYLGQLLDGFEQALELAERETIERYREAIEEFLKENDLSGGNYESDDEDGESSTP
jgi:molecular chaperone HscC